jgi:ABC-type glycerol-3-phosphate transport system permease component|tara:strand:- start:1106 stop:1990 length:885 start_codon:yes stop_codon:yes gene_type:complete
MVPDIQNSQEKLARFRRWSWFAGPLRKIIIWLPLTMLVLWTLGPFLISASVSFKEPAHVFSDASLIPDDPTLNAYARTIDRPGFQRALWNSVVIAFGSLILTLVVGVPAAYAFARYRFRGRHLLLMFSLLPMLVPKVGLMFPLFLLAVKVGGFDSRIFMILVFTGMLLPLAVWLLVGFFQAIPRELEEAAAVDGATQFAAIRTIILPLSIPALLTVAVLAFREAWNEFELVLALTQTANSRTLPYELYLMQDATGLADYPIQNAFALLTIVPLILVYLRIERYVAEGLLSGAVK